MATSQQNGRHRSQLLLMAAGLALVLLIAAGSADAACRTGWANCKTGNPDCETNIYTDKYNCGWCNHVCVLSPDYKWGEVVCINGFCVSRCKGGWHHDSANHKCVLD